MPTEIKNRRQSPRAKMAQPVRVRPFDAHYPSEVCTTINISRKGFYFTTTVAHYFKGMGVFVARNFQPEDPIITEEVAEVVRIEKLPEGRWGIAVGILKRASF